MYVYMYIHTYIHVYCVYTMYHLEVPHYSMHNIYIHTRVFTNLVTCIIQVELSPNTCTYVPVQ